MFMNDNLSLQIEKYNKIEDYHNKALFIEKMLRYYNTTNYISSDKKLCVEYWEKELDELYYVAFRYF
jgi:hypothetical protein|tara:strand:- start:324 stop:524 length:201 start_codon:yes stop_codon:yes gene_type:complete